MKQFLLYGHGSSLNHGCEAIVKTTISMIKKICDDSSIVLSTLDYDNDKMCFPYVDSFIKNNEVPDNFLFNGISYLNYKLFPKIKISDVHRYSPFNKFVKGLDSQTVCLSVGGDNYCTSNPAWLYSQNVKIDKRGAKRILWGASVEPETINGKMMNDLNGYDVIFARETITRDALLEKGYRGKLYLCSDPAFTLDTDLDKIPAEMNDGDWIGLNLSPVILRSESVAGVAYKNYYNFIDYIIKNTSYNIALIPHVVIDGNSDYDAMDQLYREFADTKRILQISNKYSASQYKGIISRCMMFIGARTHATIAAYSNCVPTLVVGYSVKAKGIAKDLFGSYENYVIPVQKMSSDGELIKMFDGFIQRIDEVKKSLEQIMPQYIQASYKAMHLLKEEL